MRLSVRAGTTVVVGTLVMAMVAPATAGVPDRSTHGVRCHSRVEFSNGHRWDHAGRWTITFALVNHRNHRSTIHGSWQIDASRRVHDGRVHRHADLASEARQKFEVSFHGQMNEAPIVGLLNCR